MCESAKSAAQTVFAVDIALFLSDVLNALVYLDLTFC